MYITYLKVVCSTKKESRSFGSTLSTPGIREAFLIDPLSLVKVESEVANEGVMWYFSLASKKRDDFIHWCSSHYPHITIEDASIDIDWQKQSEEHSPYWSSKSGFLEIPLVDGKDKLQLEAGGAFGDGSHPTTRLMLQSLHDKVRGKVVVDIGAGNGILALAALQCGALSAIGIEIDPEAVLIAMRNARINGLAEKAFFFSCDEATHFEDRLQKELYSLVSSEHLLILMNMTWGDIQQALPMYGSLIERASEMVISGILLEQKEQVCSYFFSMYTYKLISFVEDDGWLLLHFKR